MTVANIEAGSPDDTAPEPQTGAEGPDGVLPVGTPTRPDRACYFVLGMHRSGTSSVAGTLVRLGVAAPAHLLGANKGNETGHWESQPLIWFHDELLASAGSRWDDWRAFNLDWYDTPVAAQFKERANRLLDEEFDYAPLFVFKDPRNCRFARFWLEIFAERGIAPKIVLPIRSPLEVARSLHARDGFPLRKGLLLWLRHTLDAEAASRDLPRAVIEWDAFLSDWPSGVATMESALGAFPANTDLAAAEIDLFLRNDLKHQRVPQEEMVCNALVHDWVVQTYAAMRELSGNPESSSARGTLDNVRAQFDEASPLFGGVLADIDASLAEIEQRVRETEQARQEALVHVHSLQQERDAERLRLEDRLKDLTELLALERERSEREIEILRSESSQQKQNYDAVLAEIHGSWSWMLTAPMRRLRAMFGA